MGDFREPPLRGRIEREGSVLDEHHHRARRDGFRHRGNAEDRVAAHGGAAADGRHAHRVDGHIIALRHEPDCAGELVPRDPGGYRVVEGDDPALQSSTSCARPHGGRGDRGAGHQEKLPPFHGHGLHFKRVLGPVWSIARTDHTGYLSSELFNAPDCYAR